MSLAAGFLGDFTDDEFDITCSSVDDIFVNDRPDVCLACVSTQSGTLDDWLHVVETTGGTFCHYDRLDGFDDYFPSGAVAAVLDGGLVIKTGYSVGSEHRFLVVSDRINHCFLGCAYKVGH